ncbi:unnamed protein product [Cochlearia groenlandica]
MEGEGSSNRNITGLKRKSDATMDEIIEHEVRMAKKEAKQRYHALLRLAKAEKEQIAKKNKLEFKWAMITGKMAMIETMINNPDLCLKTKMQILEAKKENVKKEIDESTPEPIDWLTHGLYFMK